MLHESDPLRPVEPRRFEARFGGVDRSPLVATALVAALVGLAILKPWTAGGSPPGFGAPVRTSAAATDAALDGPRPSAAPAPSPTGAAVVGMCLDPGSWRTATIETWRDQTVRVWRAIDPGPARGPRDPTIPVVPAVGRSIPAIGYCAPTSGPDQPLGLATIRAWRLEGPAERAIQLRQILPIRGVSPYGALFGPPTELGSTGSWPNGLVVFRYDDLAAKADRWFAIEVSGTSDDGPPATLERSVASPAGAAGRLPGMPAATPPGPSKPLP